MFHWICPECGREIPPAVKHCAACDPAVGEATQSQNLTDAALSRAPEPAPESQVTRSPVVHSPVAAQPVRAESEGGTALATAEAPQALPLSDPPELLTSPLPLQLPLSFESAQGLVDPERGLAMLACPEPLPLIVQAPIQASLQTPTTPEIGMLPPPLPAAEGTDELENPLLALAGGFDSEQESGPPPLPPPSGLSIAAEPIAVEPMVLETLAPVPEPIPEPTPEPVPAMAGRTSLSSEPCRQPPSRPRVTRLAPFPAVSVAGSTPLDVFRASGVPAGVRVPAADFAPPLVTTRVPDAGTLTPRAAAPPMIAGVKGSMPEEAPAPGAGAQPSLCQPHNKISDAAPGFGWLQDYKAAASRNMRPSAPTLRALQADASARMTLPGPTLPSELLSLSQAGLSAIPGYPRRVASSGLPGWIVSLAVMAFVLIGGLGLLSYFVPNLVSNSVASAGPTDGSTDARSAVRASAYPLGKFVEVTGFRFVMDLNRRSEIHYLVVNHSSAELNGVNVFVTLHTAGSKPGQPPLCRFSFRAPEMAPYESKEMTSSIDKLTRTVAVPDWQDLRADVEIGQ
jgi:hypothetical protein